jgi:hypothetical protein
MSEAASTPPTNDPQIYNANAGASDTSAARTPPRPPPPPAIAFSSPRRGSSRSGPELTSQLNSVLDDDDEKIKERKRAEEARLITKNRLILKQAETLARTTPKSDATIFQCPKMTS